MTAVGELAEYAAGLSGDLGAEDDDRAGRGLREFLRIPEAAIGVGLFAVMVGVVFIGPLLAPYSPTEIGVGPVGAGPSNEHWLGTDSLGRDVLSRVLSGGVYILLVPIAAVAIAFAIGAVIGVSSAYFGGRVDAVVTRLIDVFLGIPAILTVLVIIAGFGTSTPVVIASVAGVFTPSIARVLRGAAQAVRPREYVLAARARGDTAWWIIFREIVPNIVATIFVELALRITFAILFISTLSFLGLGAQPPSPNWGVMIAESRLILFQNSLAALAPALAIALLAVSINLIADALTQYLGREPSREGPLL
jgi:peptide/nickel transport system permease protein